MNGPAESPKGLPPRRLHVVLVEPEIAGNVGAIGRTCVAAGATLWLIRPLGFRIDARQIRRAGLDYWPHLDYRVVDDLDEVRAEVGPGRLWFFSTKAAAPHATATYREGDALVFGPESRGLPPSWLVEHADHCVRIPIRPEARSLNLGTAVAVGVFEVLRQVDAGWGLGQS